MHQGEGHGIDWDVRVGLDPSGRITIKAVTAGGDPVKLSPDQARQIAAVLSDLADADEA